MSEDVATTALLHEALARWGESVATPRTAALLLLEEAWRLAAPTAVPPTRAQLLAFGERRLGGAALRWFRAAIDRHAAGEPIAYLLGEVGFFGRSFSVDRRVLIPRPESEHLIDAVLAVAPTPHRVLDVGTGSGALAVTIAAESPLVRVTAIDRSADALLVARGNAERHGVASRIDFLEGDLLAPLEQCEQVTFDAVVANLPYLPSADCPAFPHPTAFEPRLALDGGIDGLALYRRLLAQLAPYVHPGTVVLCEAAPPTLTALEELVVASGLAESWEAHRDYAALERYLFFRIGTGVLPR